jgi:hypothetical protein
MHRRLVIPVMLMLAVVALAACNPFATRTPTPGHGGYSVLNTVSAWQISAGTRDSYNIPSSHSFTTNEIRMGQTTVNNTAGFLFSQVGTTIPKDAWVASAYITMNISSTVGTPSLLIYGEDADTCINFSSGSWPVSRTTTAASVAWTPGAGTGIKTSPDIKSIIQYLVNLAGWGIGDNICIIVKDNQASDNQYQDAYAYEKDPAQAARLTIEWDTYTPTPTVTPTPTDTPTATNTPTATATSTPTNTPTATGTPTTAPTGTPTNTATVTPTPTICGRVSANTTWSGTNTLACNLSVASGVTLTLDAGTVVQFSGAYYADVQGRVVANGTAAQPVLWTRQSGVTAGSWGPLYIVGAGSSMDYVTMTYGIGLSAGAPITLTHLWAYTNTYGLDLAANASVTSATLRANTYGVQVRLNARPVFSVTNILTSTTAGMVIEQSRDLPAAGIWWGTTDAATIEGYITDDIEDIRRGRALWSPAAAALWAW